MKVFKKDDFTQVGEIPTGALPHGIWPSGDGTRVYVGLENADAVAAIDTLTNKVIATIPIGQAPQGVAYVPNADPTGSGMQNLMPLGQAGKATHLVLADRTGKTATRVTLFDQGILQVLQAAPTGLEPKMPYLLALADNPKGTGTLEPLAMFMSNPAGAAIVNTVGPLRQLDRSDASTSRRYLVITPSQDGKAALPVQLQKQ